MTLLRDIQGAAIADTVPLSQVLRMAKVLASRLDHEALKQWVDSELNGYESGEIPAYRVLQVQSRGTFMGAFGAGWKNVPLPSLSVSEKYRELVTKHKVFEGVAAIEAILSAKPQTSLHAPWSPDLVVLEGQNMMQGFSLVEAWQEIPAQSMAAILDTVRNKILDFALELDREVPTAGEGEVDEPIDSKVSQIFHLTILGGTANVAAGTTLAPGAHLTQSVEFVKIGELETLREYLTGIGITAEDVVELETAIREDDPPQQGKGFGERASSWIGKMVGKAASGSWQVSVGAAGDLLARAIARYYGIG